MCSAIQPCLRARYEPMRKRETFLAQQNIAAVTGADRNNRVVLRKMADETPRRIDI